MYIVIKLLIYIKIQLDKVTNQKIEYMTVVFLHFRFEIIIHYKILRKII